MLYTFHHIFSLPRGWLCCTLITSQGVMHIASTWAANGGLNGKPYKPLVVAPLSALFGCLSTLFYAHSKPTEINRAFAHFFFSFSFFLLLLRFVTRKIKKKKTNKKNSPTLCPPFHLQDWFQHRGQLHKAATLWTKSEASSEQCPCSGTQRDTLLLCYNTHTLIDCVSNNYGGKREALHQTVTQMGKCCLRQVVTVEEARTWSLFNQMYWTLKPLLSNSERNVVTARSSDTQENPCTI